MPDHYLYYTPLHWALFVFECGSAILFGLAVIRLINALVAQAVQQGASDIHLEPQEEGMSVRLRRDGVMEEVLRLPAQVARQFFDMPLGAAAPAVRDRQDARKGAGTQAGHVQGGAVGLRGR